MSSSNIYSLSRVSRGDSIPSSLFFILWHLSCKVKVEYTHSLSLSLYATLIFFLERIYYLANNYVCTIFNLIIISWYIYILHACTRCSFRAFNEIAENNKACIYKKVSLEGLPIDGWRNNDYREQVASFLRNCIENENPEALYRQGLVFFFPPRTLLQVRFFSGNIITLINYFSHFSYITVYIFGELNLFV